MPCVSRFVMRWRGQQTVTDGAVARNEALAAMPVTRPISGATAAPPPDTPLPVVTDQAER